MKTMRVATLMAVVSLGLTSAPASAQTRIEATRPRVRVDRDGSRENRARYDRDDDRYDDNDRYDYDDDRYEYDNDRYERPGKRVQVRFGARLGGGGIYVSYGRHPLARARWDRVRWGRVNLYAPRRTERNGWAPVREILDRRVVDRLHRQRARLGLRGRLTARWTRDRYGARFVQVRSGGFLLAEMRDHNRDGRADRILVARF